MYILFIFVYLFLMIYVQKVEDIICFNSCVSLRELLSFNSYYLMLDDDIKLSLIKVDVDGELEINEVKVIYVNYLDDCFCKIC